MRTKQSDPTLRAWLKNEPFTLSLSAGFFGFYAHAGLVSALEDEALIPRNITGSSAGALVGGLWASGCAVNEFSQTLFDLSRSDFWDPSPCFGLLRGQRFDQILQSILRCERIEATPIPVKLAVFEIARCKTRYLTEGKLSDAIRASCAFPGLFQPVLINSKKHLDGGILDRSSLGAVEEGLPTLYHHLTSRSRVRRKIKMLTSAPQRRNSVVIATPNLPKLSPFKLEEGQKAFAIAKAHFRAQLDKPAQVSPL